MKRYLLIFLTLLLCVTMVLGGCSTEKAGDSTVDNEQKSVEEDTTEKEKNTGNKSDTEEEQSLVTPPGEFPVVKEKVTFTMLAPRDALVEDLNTNDCTVWYEEKTNVHVEFEQIPEDQFNEKFKIIMAGGDYPDVIVGRMMPPSEVMYYASQGVIIPINEYIDKHGYYYKKMLEDAPDLIKNITAPDGNIYSFPIAGETLHMTAPMKMWVYQPWLEKLNIDTPETTEDFYLMLKAFKEEDPNENGKADEIPYAFANSGLPINGWKGLVDGFLMNPFIYSDESYLMVKDGKVQFTADKLGFKQGLRFLRKLYSEGLIYPESFVMQGTQIRELGENPEPILGSVSAGHTGIFAINFGKSGRYKEYYPIAPLEGPDGLKQAATFPPGAQCLQGCFITNKANHPEVITRWMDWFYSMEGSATNISGLEGVGWRMPKEGEVGINGEPASLVQLKMYTEVQNGWWSNIFPRYFPSKIRAARIPLGGVNDASPETILYKSTNKLYEPYKVNEYIPPSLWFNREQVAEVAEISNTVYNYVHSSVAQFITGEKNIDSDWDSYVNEFKVMNADRWVSFVQEEYDRQKGLVKD